MNRIGDQTSDGRYQWDGQRWVPTPLGIRTGIAPSAPLTEPDAPPQHSPDGRFWWDGNQWIPVPPQVSSPGYPSPYGYQLPPSPAQHFSSGFMGCLGVGAAIIVVIIVLAIIGSSH
jgi:hypothetical protein